MMKNLTLENIAGACQGIYHGAEEKKACLVSSITKDSREVEAGCLFVPIKGERVDAHDFIPQVMEAGALCTLSEKDLGEVPYPWIQVESSLTAVKDIAAFYLDQLNIPVVGITGSVGKTSTKEAIACVLGEKWRVKKTPGNLNNELGLPLTVFTLREGDEIAVLEMGINHFGEMTRLAKIARPSTMVITCIGTAHLENLGDRDGILRAKTEVLPFVREGGHLLFNGDDDKLSTIQSYGDIKVDFFGTDPEKNLDCKVLKERSKGFSGTDATFQVFGETFDVSIPLPGKHMVVNALAAAAVGKYYGLTCEQVQRGIASMTSMKGRFHVIQKKRLTIVDDCYNANPDSMKASLDILRQEKGAGRRVAILGDMGELGENEIAMHKEIGAYASGCVDELICVGKLAKYMAGSAMEAGRQVGIRYEASLASLLENLPRFVNNSDLILVKASHFMGFEKVVKALEELD